jgi:ABC-type oligopeptide transport system ATPase subunit
MPLIEIRNLTKIFPGATAPFGATRVASAAAAKEVRAVDGVSLDIHAGETLGLVGESGSGKSTLGRLILRLIEPTSGSVQFEGRDLLSARRGEMRRLRRDLQIIFQDPFASLDPRFRVEDIIAEPLLIHGLGRNDRLGRDDGLGADKGLGRDVRLGRDGGLTRHDGLGSDNREGHDFSRADTASTRLPASAAGGIRARVSELLRAVGLDESARARYPHEFSGGQRQRIGIARALALRPKFIVCDEPVSALDVSVGAQIVNLLAQLQREFGLTYLFISHSMPVVRYLSTRIAVMYRGKIVEAGDTDQITERPVHPYTRSLLEATPELLA